VLSRGRVRTITLPLLRHWRMSLIKSAPAATHGYIEAPDAERATRKANEQFDIKDPHTQRRRIAAQLHR
jgi:hypothetical protein